MTTNAYKSLFEMQMWQILNSSLSVTLTLVKNVHVLCPCFDYFEYCLWQSWQLWLKPWVEQWSLGTNAWTLHKVASQLWRIGVSYDGWRLKLTVKCDVYVIVHIIQFNNLCRNCDVVKSEDCPLITIHLKISRNFTLISGIFELDPVAECCCENRGCYLFLVIV